MICRPICTGPRGLSQVVLALAFVGMVVVRPAPTVEATIIDPFDSPHTYWDGSSVDVNGTIWDGVLNTGNATSVIADLGDNNKLVFDMNTNSSTSNNDFTATTLYMDVTGCFDAKVEVVGFPAATYETIGIVAYENSGDTVMVMDIYNADPGQGRFRHYEDGGSVPVAQITSANQKSWLRMTRVDNTFRGYYGTDGINWTEFTGTGAPFVRTDLSATMKIGLFAATANTSGTFDAQFDNFSMILIPEPTTLVLLGIGGLAALA